MCEGEGDVRGRRGCKGEGQLLALERRDVHGAKRAGAQPCADRQTAEGNLELARGHGGALRRVEQCRRRVGTDGYAQGVARSGDGGDAQDVGTHQRRWGDAQLLEHRHERGLELGGRTCKGVYEG